MQKTLLLTMFSLLIVSAPVSGAETIVARIECPAETKAKMIWPDKIEGDPSFSRTENENEWIVFTFKEMKREEQKITCSYHLLPASGGSGVVKNYNYTAKRKIAWCTKVSTRILDCRLAQ